jgi:hypothetical protein
MDMNSNIIDIINPQSAPKKPKMKDIFILSSKNITKPVSMDKSLDKKTVVQLKKMAKAKGIKGYQTMRKTGLIDVLGVDDGKHFAVQLGKKGNARVGKAKGKRLAFDKSKK